MAVELAARDDAARNRRRRRRPSSICSGRTRTPTAHGSDAGTSSSTPISPSTDCTTPFSSRPSSRFPWPTKRATSPFTGPRVEDVRLVALHDRPALEHRDPVGDRERLVLVVRDEDRGRAGRREHVDDLAPHARAQLDVERGERLVEQHERGPRGERAGERDPLALAAREVVRQPLLEPAEPDHLEQLRDARVDHRPVACRPSPSAARRRRCPRRSGAGRARLPAARSRSGAAPAARTASGPSTTWPPSAIVPCVGVVEAGDQAHQRRLAASRGAEDRGQRARLDLERDAVEHDPLAERLPQARRPRPRPSCLARSRRGPGDPLEPAAEQEPRKQRHEQQREGVRRRGAVGEVAREGPEAGRERVDARRVEDQRRGQLGRGADEDEREAGDQRPARSPAA